MTAFDESNDLQFNLHLDMVSENALAQEVYDLGGVVIPTTFQGWPFPRLTVPLPPRRTESTAEIEARRASEDRTTKGWKRAVANRLCASRTQLCFWFSQVISEEELNLPANRVDDAFSFPDLFTADIVLHNLTVGRNHAVLTRSEEGHLVEDLDSRPGTFVNGVQIKQPVLLIDGDIIHMGSVRLMYRCKMTET